MGQPDLIIIINGVAYLMEGANYDDRQDAIKRGILKHNQRIDNEIKMVEEAKQEDLSRDKDDFLNELHFEREVDKLEVYEIF